MCGDELFVSIKYHFLIKEYIIKSLFGLTTIRVFVSHHNVFHIWSNAYLSVLLTLKYDIVTLSE